MAASGVFALLLVVGFLKHLQTVLSKQEFKKLFLVGGAIAAAAVFGAVVILTMCGVSNFPKDLFSICFFCCVCSIYPLINQDRGIEGIVKYSIAKH